MNDQSQKPITDPNPPASAQAAGSPGPSNPPDSSPGSQRSGAPSSTPPPVYRDWREQRRAARWARREARWQERASHPYFGLVGGIILILLGTLFVLQNMGILSLKNWWALFILIPAFWAYLGAWESYRHSGRLTRNGVGLVVFGTLVAILAVAFLFDLNLGLLWPVLLIVGGLALLFAALRPA